MSISSNITAASLLGKGAKVRSFYADPVEKLGNERSNLERISHDTREQAEELSISAGTLADARRSVETLARMWTEGKLAVMQEAAAAFAEKTAGNPLASIALGTQQKLSALFSAEGSDPEKNATEAAVVLAGAMGNDPANYAANLNKGLNEFYYGLPGGNWIEGGDVSPTTLLASSEKMSQQSQSLQLGADQKYAQAKEEWSAVEGVQSQLNQHFQARRKNAHFSEKKAAAQEFLADLKTASESNPDITREMRAQAKESGSWLGYDPNGLLTSYNSQLAKNNGDVGKLDWNKLVRQFEGTSFGR